MVTHNRIADARIIWQMQVYGWRLCALTASVLENVVNRCEMPRIASHSFGDGSFKFIGSNPVQNLEQAECRSAEVLALLR